MTVPDKWIVVKIDKEGEDTIYKVFATWYGGYGDGDSWQMNSGIVGLEVIEKTYKKTVFEEDGPKQIETKAKVFEFKGVSGSVYSCYEGSYGMSGYSSGVLDGIMKNSHKVGATIEVMPENANWEELFSYEQDEEKEEK